jgi:hypothetical protein
MCMVSYLKSCRGIIVSINSFIESSINEFVETKNNLAKLQKIVDLSDSLCDNVLVVRAVETHQVTGRRSSAD